MIITTEANELLKEVHDRVPVILPREAEAVSGLLVHLRAAARNSFETSSISNWPLEKSRRFEHSPIVIASD